MNHESIENEVIFQLARLGEIAEAGAAMGRSTIADVQELRKQIAQATAAIDETIERLRGGKI